MAMIVVGHFRTRAELRKTPRRPTAGCFAGRTKACHICRPPSRKRELEILPSERRADMDASPGFERRHRRRTGSSAIGLGLACALAVVSLGGCGASSVATWIDDPGKYSAYHCKELAGKQKELAKRAQDLRDLMAKADDGSGGSVVGALSYRTNYEVVVGDQKLVEHEAVEKKCDFISPPVTDSDRVIR